MKKVIIFKESYYASNDPSKPVEVKATKWLAENPNITILDFQYKINQFPDTVNPEFEAIKQETICILYETNE